jgi:hypothetical protein
MYGRGPVYAELNAQIKMKRSVPPQKDDPPVQRRRTELDEWASNVETKYKGVKVDIINSSAWIRIKVVMRPENVILFEWLLSDKELELVHFMYNDGRYSENIVEAAKKLFPERTLLGIVSEMTQFLVQVGTDKDRTFDLCDGWKSPHTQKGHSITSTGIRKVAKKYCIKGEKGFTPKEKVLFESCKRKITRTLGPNALNAASDGSPPPIWDDLSAHGIYGLMWDKDDKVRTVTDVCC